MRKNFLSKTVIILATVIIFVACKDDPVVPPPPPTDNYFGTPNGSWWVYSNHTVDGEGNSQDLNKFDTLRQMKDTTFLNLPSKLMQHYFNNVTTGGVNTANYHIIERDNKLFVSKNFFGLFMPDLLVQYLNALPDTVRLADRVNNSWSLAEIDAPNLSELFDLSDLPIDILNITGKFKIEFKRGSNVSISGYNCHSYTMQIKAMAVAVIEHNLPFPPSPIEFPFEALFAEFNFYLSQNLGLVEVSAKPIDGVTVSIPIYGTHTLPLDYTLAGFKKTLKETNVVPTN